jgi:hypothetical protein
MRKKESPMAHHARAVFCQARLPRLENDDTRLTVTRDNESQSFLNYHLVIVERIEASQDAYFRLDDMIVSKIIDPRVNALSKFFPHEVSLDRREVGPC